MNKMNLQNFIALFILSCLLIVLSLKGWDKRKEIVFQFNITKVIIGINNETKCYALKEVLRLSQTRNIDLSTSPKYSDEKDYLNRGIKQSYPQEDSEVRYSAIVSKKYAVAEIEERLSSGSSPKVWKGAVLQMVMFKKHSNGEFQPIYSCLKFLG